MVVLKIPAKNGMFQIKLRSVIDRLKRTTATARIFVLAASRMGATRLYPRIAVCQKGHDFRFEMIFFNPTDLRQNTIPRKRIPHFDLILFFLIMERPIPPASKGKAIDTDLMTRHDERIHAFVS